MNESLVDKTQRTPYLKELLNLKKLLTEIKILDFFLYNHINNKTITDSNHKGKGMEFTKL